MLGRRLKKAMAGTDRTFWLFALASLDHFLLRQRLKALLDRLAKQAGGALEETHFDGAVADVAEVLDEVRTWPMLGGRRIAIVTDGDKFLGRHKETLESCFSEAEQPGFLVLTAASFDKRLRITKILEQQGRVEQAVPPGATRLPAWVVQWAREQYRKQMDGATAARLVELVGSDLGMLDAELAKLSTYARERGAITQEDISELTSLHREENVFRLMEALLRRDRQGAIRIWRQTLATDRSAVGRAVPGLAWGVRQWLDVHREARRGAPAAAFARRLRLEPAAVAQTLKRAPQRGLEQFMQGLLRADLAVKSGAAIEPTIENWIISSIAKLEEAVPARLSGAERS